MWTVAGAALFALLVLASSLSHTSVMRRGIAATVVTVALIVAIEAARSGPVNRLLSCAPAVYLGKISYGTYLWHWPVILIALSLTDDSISPLSLFAVSALLATGLASLSFTILERPVREQKLLDRLNPVVIGVGLAITVTCALVIVPFVLDPYRSGAGAVKADVTTGFTPIGNVDLKSAADDYYDITHDQVPEMGPELDDVPFRPFWGCEGRKVEVCTIVKGSGKHVLVIGDSHAWAMFPTFAKIAKDHDLTLSTAARGACPWQRDVYFAGLPDTEHRRQSCMRYKKDLYDRVIPGLKPDLIVAITADYLGEREGDLWSEDGQPIPVANPADLFEKAAENTRKSLSELTAHGAKVLVVDPIPATTFDNDPVKCLGENTVLEACRFVTSEDASPLERMYRADADNRTVYEADFDKLVCPFKPICDPVVKGKLVRFDQQHLTPDFALSLADPVYTSCATTGCSTADAGPEPSVVVADDADAHPEEGGGVELGRAPRGSRTVRRTTPRARGGLPSPCRRRP